MKNLKEILLMVSFMGVAFSNCFAQGGLKIGDSVPKVYLSNVLFYSKSQIDLSSEFRGKVLLLDFFGTYCGPCIAALPHLDSLQKSFGGQLQVMLVDAERSDVIKDFFQKHPIGRKVSFPVVSEDTILGGIQESTLFKFNSIPTEVLISPDGRVQAITRSDAITNESIVNILSGKKVDFQIKRYTKYNDNLMTTLMSSQKEDLVRYSFFGREVSGMGTIIGTPDLDRKMSRIEMTVFNCPILELFKLAYLGDRGMLYPSCWLVKPDMDTSFMPDFSTGKNVYCYELRLHYDFDAKIPGDVIDSQIKSIGYRNMQNDLAGGTGMVGHVENRVVRCFEIHSMSVKRGIIPADTAVDRGIFESGDKEKIIHFRKEPLSDVIFALLYVYNTPIYIIDKSGYKGPVNLDIKFQSLDDGKKMDQELKTEGLYVVETKMNADVLVLSYR
jgi:thiol-disulfide isomerase/thioredoxin